MKSPAAGNLGQAGLDPPSAEGPLPFSHPFLPLQRLWRAYGKPGTVLDTGESGRTEAAVLLSLVAPGGQRERQPF